MKYKLIYRDIQSVEDEMQILIKEIENIDDRTRERYSECSRVIESVQFLLESVNSDIKEFK